MELGNGPRFIREKLDAILAELDAIAAIIPYQRFDPAGIDDIATHTDDYRQTLVGMEARYQHCFSLIHELKSGAPELLIDFRSCRPLSTCTTDS